MTTSLLERLEAQSPAIAELLRLSGVLGVSLGVFHHGQVVHTAHMGQRDVRNPETLNDDSVWCSASTLNIVAACAVARLVSDGLLAWDEPIRNHLPGLRRRDAFGEQGTGQQNGEVLLPKTQFVDMVDSMKQKVKPFRSTFVYSKWNACLIQLIVEKVTGQEFGSYVSDAIFMPLGLTTTTFEELPGQNVVGPHFARTDGSSGPIKINLYNSSTGLAAGCGGKSSLKDHLRLCMALLHAYQHQTANEVDSTPDSPFTHLRTVFSPCIALPRSQLEQEAYCLGVYRTRLPGNLSCGSLNGGLPRNQIPIFEANEQGGSTEEVFHHAGLCPGYVHAMMLVPRTQSGVVVLTNATPLVDASDFSTQLLLSVLLNVRPPENLLGLAARSVQMQLGWYTQMQAALDGLKTLAVSETKTGLRLSCQGMPNTTYDLKPLGGDSFFWAVNRDLELSGGSLVDVLPQFHVIHFEVDERGVRSLSWQHDHLMKADVFQKRGEWSARL
ncbi:beta-lactamase/transpeptidase-like protein [Lentithecium fluviatile CBS 122367]|uniref:Beta-lactamase/transpeptidase-like protein n=1 Tax=Lentithecium fluviatile CBS 122367 TaxID=1168545 RepID=A0A6G1ISE9_9PLEO|nr:beta-lactamase/transpeptidase-like protein [Lentithecium fluviatile CBS 122367]